MVDIGTVRAFYERLNADAEAAGELDDVIPFEDPQYYSDAIQNDFGVSEGEADRLAKELCEK